MTENPWNLQPFAGFSRHYWSESIPRNSNNDLKWVSRWHNPRDLRDSAPVQCRKFLSKSPTLFTSSVPGYWVSQSEPSLKTFSRSSEEKIPYQSSPSSRCESWSTLRQMLPSAGCPVRHPPPKWGTDNTAPPRWTDSKLKRFPHINSPMTKYVGVYRVVKCLL